MVFNLYRVVYLCMLFTALTCGDEGKATVFQKTGCIHETYLESLVVLDDCLPGEVILVTEASYAHPNPVIRLTCANNLGLRTSCKSASKAEIKCNNKEFCLLKAVAKGYCEVKINNKNSIVGTYPAVFLVVKYRCIQVNSATVTCPVLEAPAGGHIKLPTSRNLLSEAEFGCDPGLTLSGSDRRQCQGDSTWNGVQPVCSIPSSLCPKLLLVSTFHNYCYEFQLNFTKWETAKSMCEEQNGTLVDASVEGVVQYLGWQAEKIGFEYFHTLQKTVILLKSYNGQWINSSVPINIWILPFICQYGPYYVDEQTTHPVYISTSSGTGTSTGTGTGSTVTAHGQVQVSDYLPKYLLWIIIGTCGGVVLVMLVVISVLVRKLHKTKHQIQRKNINYSTPTQDYQNVTFK